MTEVERIVMVCETMIKKAKEDALRKRKLGFTSEYEDGLIDAYTAIVKVYGGNN